MTLFSAERSRWKLVPYLPIFFPSAMSKCATSNYIWEKKRKIGKYAKYFQSYIAVYNEAFLRPCQISLREHLGF